MVSPPLGWERLQELPLQACPCHLGIFLSYSNTVCSLTTTGGRSSFRGAGCRVGIWVQGTRTPLIPFSAPTSILMPATKILPAFWQPVLSACVFLHLFVSITKGIPSPIGFINFQGMFSHKRKTALLESIFLPLSFC